MWNFAVNNTQLIIEMLLLISQIGKELGKFAMCNLLRWSCSYCFRDRYMCVFVTRSGTHIDDMQSSTNSTAD